MGPSGDLLLDDLLAAEFGDLEEPDDILFDRWYRGLLDTALKARIRAQLTQAQIAERMGTKQPAITQIERDDDGSVSAHRLWSYLRACGLVPTADLISVDIALDFLRRDPLAEIHAVAIERYRESNPSMIMTDKSWAPLRGHDDRIVAGTTRKESHIGFQPTHGSDDWSSSLLSGQNRAAENKAKAA